MLKKIMCFFVLVLFISCTTTESSRPQKKTPRQVLINYVSFVLNPTSDKNRYPVKLENESLIIIYKPDLIYKMTDKTTNVTTTGKFGFSVEADNFENNYTSLFEVDPAMMSTEEFLNSDYYENSQIQFTTIDCDQNSVTYKYVKPDSLRGQTITFSISWLPKEN